MKSTRKFIFIAFILSILYVLYEAFPFFTKGKIFSKNKKLIEITNGQSADATDNIKSNPSQEEIFTAQEQRKKKLMWGRNPFLYPEDIDPSKETEEPQTKSSEPSRTKVVTKGSFKLTSIIITNDQKTAIIDQEPFVVRKNDKINGQRVLDIHEDRIIVERNGKRRIVYLKKTGISYRHKEGAK